MAVTGLSFVVVDAAAAAVVSAGEDLELLKLLFLFLGIIVSFYVYI